MGETLCRNWHWELPDKLSFVGIPFTIKRHRVLPDKLSLRVEPSFTSDPKK